MPLARCCCRAGCSELRSAGFYAGVVNMPDPSQPRNCSRRQRGFTRKSIGDPVKRTRSLNPELANGRPAMVAVVGTMFQNGSLGTCGAEMGFPDSAFKTC